jgi:tRNA(His) 5'-end guanylyltransferase
MNAEFSNRGTYVEWYRNGAANYRSATDRESRPKKSAISKHMRCFLICDVKCRNGHRTQSFLHQDVMKIN